MAVCGAASRVDMRFSVCYQARMEMILVIFVVWVLVVSILPPNHRRRR